MTEYRKIIIRNEYADTWAAVKLWIAQFTDSPDDEISIALGTNAGVQSVEGVGATYVSPDSKSMQTYCEHGRTGTERI
ncbi:hypothetical protein [Methanococcoides seepicolus]|uniref:Uncharacterized protein n=1 Tax=Methanococcoides seepicolus TaxID=2828780 RepID=A0A9E5DCE7_9EURY|nr:hypothetical protein [Methanococcoides seepicolus]MCM1987268.1 hypothetical protein [Methanococcoides seepicolus]